MTSWAAYKTHRHTTSLHQRYVGGQTTQATTHKGRGKQGQYLHQEYFYKGTQETLREYPRQKTKEH